MQGFFKLTLDAHATPVLAVSKRDYLDTVLLIEPQTSKNILVQILPKSVPVVVYAPSNTASTPSLSADSAAATPLVGTAALPADFADRWIVNLVTNVKQRMIVANIGNSLRQPAQVSVIPALGTHGALSGAITYGFSLNMLGGYVGGIDGLEIGSLLT